MFAQVPGPASDTRVEEPVDVALHEPAPAAEVLADDGALWDPLPMTLPTYVNKARARRTVRTIELTGLHTLGPRPGRLGPGPRGRRPPRRPPTTPTAGSPAPDAPIRERPPPGGNFFLALDPVDPASAQGLWRSW